MKKFSPPKLILLIIGGIFIIACILVSLKVFGDRPQDLGPELEYIGKEHTGCPLPLPLGYIMLCSMAPSERYYFTTDLTPDQLKDYFPGATNRRIERREYPAPIGPSSTEVGFSTLNGTSGFTVEYLEDPALIRKYSSRQSFKQYLLRLSQSSYKAALNEGMNAGD